MITVLKRTGMDLASRTREIEDSGPGGYSCKVTVVPQEPGKFKGHTR